MKNILCFGDSNTFGLKPDGTGRYDFNIRYPGVLQNILGNNYNVIEEGLPGRTTIFEDKKRPFRKGIDYIVPCVQSHNPLDYVIIMLGTNDCKTANNASAEEIASGLTKIITTVKNNTDAYIIIISPIYLGEKIGTEGYDLEFNQQSIATSKELSKHYLKVAEKYGCGFIDCAKIALASKIDEEHLDETGHSNLGKQVANFIINLEKEKQFQ